LANPIPCNSGIDLDVVVILLHLMLSIFRLVGGADEHLGGFLFSLLQHKSLHLPFTY